MKKKYERPEAWWVSFQLSKELAADITVSGEGGGITPPWSSDEGYQFEDGPGAMD